MTPVLLRSSVWWNVKVPCAGMLEAIIMLDLCQSVGVRSDVFARMITKSLDPPVCTHHNLSCHLITMLSSSLSSSQRAEPRYVFMAVKG